MQEINKAYQKWEKEKTVEAKELWYKAVRRFSEIHSSHIAVEHKRNRHRKSQTQAQRELRRNR